MIHYITAHPSLEEWAKGYAAGLEANSEWPLDTYEVRISADCPALALDSPWTTEAENEEQMHEWAQRKRSEIDEEHPVETEDPITTAIVALFEELAARDGVPVKVVVDEFVKSYLGKDEEHPA